MGQEKILLLSEKLVRSASMTTSSTRFERRAAMAEATDSEAPTVQFVVCISLRGPIKPGDYKVGGKKINVSYPSQVALGLSGPIHLPVGLSTLFIVSWLDVSKKTSELLESKSYERHLPIHDSLALISKLLMAFKLVRIGHADGMRIRTVGISDTLFYYSLIDGRKTGDLNVGLRLDTQLHPWAATGPDPWDRNGTTELALPHVDADTFPIARRFVRCFELLEHGFYKETVIIAHAILDDTVQAVVRDQLGTKGLSDKKSQDALLRAIKEERLTIYLGSLLKALTGISIEDIWSEAPQAVGWLNTTRNRIAHAGSSDSRSDACKAIFVATKVIAALRSRGLLQCDFPTGMLRAARITAAWTQHPEKWVPTNSAVETDPFD
jgi:hypothetical protein